MSLGPIALGGAAVAAASPRPAAASGPVSVASALATLRLRPGATVAISDTAANLQRNLDALQAVAARITGLATTDASAKLSVSAAQYQKDAAILAKWGATDGNTAEVTGVAAASASSFAAARADWVSTFTVADSSANLAANLDSLQTLASDGSLRQIVHTGEATPLKITRAQLAADADALAAIKNGAYTLSVTEASVADTLGLDGKTALTANARIKSIHVKDTTAAIEDNLDALQHVGLQLKSISQTDADQALTLSATQLKGDAIAIGKILTPYHLDVIRAAAAQVAQLKANARVLTVSVSDTAAHIAQRWSLLNRLADSLGTVEVTDPSNAVAVSADQLTLDDGLLAKFTEDADHPFSLAVSGVKAGQAAELAAIDHVGSLSIADSADNVAASLADLETLQGQGLLADIALTGKSKSLSLAATQVRGDAATATQAVLDKISSINWGLAIDGASLDDLEELAANDRVTSIAFEAAGDDIASHLDALAGLGRRLARIDQSDGGTALDLTQAEFDSHASVLARIDGGYTVNLSGASAAKAIVDATNGHVASIAVEDTGRNLALQWRALRSMGDVLSAVSKSDEGALAVSANGYLLAQTDGLIAKFGAGQGFTLSNASVAQAQQLAADDAVDGIDLLDDGSAVAAGIDDLADLAAGGKLGSIVLTSGATRIALQASQLAGAQDVLDLVKDARYTLALDGVDVADLGTLLESNDKVAAVRVSGDAAGIQDHLAALGSAGAKLLAITRTDGADVALSLSGADFDSYRFQLAKIAGGYVADLSDVGASRVATLAANAHIHAMAVSDTGANLSAAWSTLAAVGDKVSEVAQSDSTLIGLTATQWARTASLGGKFSSTLALSISGATVADLASLGSDDAVREVQVSDNAATIADAWSDLAQDAKLASLTITDASTALAMSAATYAASADLLALVPDGRYSVALADAAVADAATLQADSHVASFDVTGSSEDIAAAFDDFGGLGKLGTLALSDEGGTLTLGTAQVLGGSATLARIGNGYRIAATGAALADLGDLQAVDNLASIGVADTAAHVADGLDELAALGSLLDGVHLSDTSPVLALTQAERSDGAAVLAKIDGSFAVDLSQVDPGSVAALVDEATIRHIDAAGTADGVAQNWSALVAAYNDGAGKLTALTLTDDLPLTLTETQQTEGAALIAAFLSSQTIVTA